MANLNVTEIKAFVPAKDFEISKQFYKDLGFTMASEGGGIAYFHFQGTSFLLQDYCADDCANHFMMHLLVEEVDAWWEAISAADLVSKYNVTLYPIETQAWKMRDFCLTDPSGVLWRIGQNVE